MWRALAVYYPAITSVLQGGAVWDKRVCLILGDLASLRWQSCRGGWGQPREVYPIQFGQVLDLQIDPTSSVPCWIAECLAAEEGGRVTESIILSFALVRLYIYTVSVGQVRYSSVQRIRNLPIHSLPEADRNLCWQVANCWEVVCRETEAITAQVRAFLLFECIWDQEIDTSQVGTL